MLWRFCSLLFLFVCLLFLEDFGLETQFVLLNVQSIKGGLFLLGSAFARSQTFKSAQAFNTCKLSGPTGYKIYIQLIKSKSLVSSLFSETLVETWHIIRETVLLFTSEKPFINLKGKEIAFLLL